MILVTLSFLINSENDFFTLNNGSFEYTLEAKDNLKASGDYIFQNDLLVLFYSKPNDTIRRYRVSKVTDSTLILSENNIQYSFSTGELETTQALNPETIESDIVAVARLYDKQFMERYSRHVQLTYYCLLI